MAATPAQRARHTAPLLALLAGLALAAGAAEPPGYSRARTLIRDGQLDAGVALLRPLLAASPGNLKVRNLLGIALTAKGDLAAANREFLRALETNPSFYPALKNLAANELALGNLAAARRHFTRAAQLAPDDPVIHAHLGRIAFAERDFARASEHLARAVPPADDDAHLAALLVLSHLETGHGDAARSALRTVDLRPAPLALRFQVALALAQRDSFDLAAPLFEGVHAEDPDSYDAGFNLAVCYVQSKQFDKAVGPLRALAARGHRRAELYNLLAAALEGSEQTQAAIDALREATTIAPADEDNYLDLAALCIDHKAHDLGLEVLEVGLRNRPQSDRLMFQRGVLYALKGEAERAEESFRLASRLAPDKNLAYAGLSLTYMQTGDVQEAVRTLRERVRQKPDDPLLLYLLGKALMQTDAAQDSVDLADARAALGRLYLRQRLVDQAVAMLEAARELDPTDKAVTALLGTAYARQGRHDKAEALAAALARLNDDEWAREAHRRLRLFKPGEPPSP